jgi:hypothetical protein
VFGEGLHHFSGRAAGNPQLLAPGGSAGFEYRPAPQDFTENPFNSLVGFSAFRRSRNANTQGVIVDAHHLGCPCAGHNPHIDNRIVGGILVGRFPNANCSSTASPQ